MNAKIEKTWTKISDDLQEDLRLGLLEDPKAFRARMLGIFNVIYATGKQSMYDERGHRRRAQEHRPAERSA